jgi:Na+/glutamate symporter
MTESFSKQSTGAYSSISENETVSQTESFDDINLDSTLHLILGLAFGAVAIIVLTAIVPRIIVSRKRTKRNKEDVREEGDDDKEEIFRERTTRKR